MANSDYVKRNLALPFCPQARLASGIAQLTPSLTYNNLISPIANPIQVGRAILIDDEILGITGISGNTLTVARGCCDTIPATHSANARIWFFDDSVGSDEIEYGGNQTIGVKVLPKTPTAPNIPIEGSPPNGISFNFRFARPYPPANVLIDGVPWFTSGINLNAANGDVVLTWAHRNRISQADQLVGHTEPSVTPEVGTTYTIVVKRVSTGATIRTVTGITDTTWTYTRAQASTDLAASGTIPISIELFSVRDSLASLYGYTMSVAVEAVDLTQFYWDSTSFITNPVTPTFAESGALMTLTNIAIASGGFGGRTRTDIVGKVYCEFELVSQNNNSNFHGFGLVLNTATNANAFSSSSHAALSRSPNTNTGCGVPAVSGLITSGAMTGNAAYSHVPGNRIGIAFDAATRKVWYRINGNWVQGDPAAGTGESHTLPAGTYRFGWLNYICGGTSLTNSARIYPNSGSQTGSMPAGFSGYAG